MKTTNGNSGAISHMMTSARIVLATMTACCLLYGLLVLAVGQLVSTHSAEGSLVRNKYGEIIGSKLIAQGFSHPEHFWARPSAVEYNASAAGGSNLSPASPELRDRAETTIMKMGTSHEKRIPADLITASGSGLDPHITLSAAKYQVKRVAKARGRSVADVMTIVEKHLERPGGPFTPEPVLNVLLLNMALDRMDK